MTTIFLNILAFSVIISSILSITSKNPVISVIFLISAFVSGAGYLIGMGIYFVGISYVIVYVGAIAVLFLFVIMMINIKLTDILETGSQFTKNLPLAIAICFLFLFIFLSYINVPSYSGSILFSFFLFLCKYKFFQDIFFGSDPLAYLLYQIKNTYPSNLDRDLISFSSDEAITVFSQIEALGYSLYTYGPVLLITLSIILLLAMIAIIVISKIKK